MAPWCSKFKQQLLASVGPSWSIETKIEKNAWFLQQYTEILEGYICKGHACKVESINSNV